MKTLLKTLTLAALLVTSCTARNPEKEALDFLYAYMPAADAADYPREPIFGYPGGIFIPFYPRSIAFLGFFCYFCNNQPHT